MTLMSQVGEPGRPAPRMSGDSQVTNSPVHVAAPPHQSYSGASFGRRSTVFFSLQHGRRRFSNNSHITVCVS
jgi:hypothetical protein